MEERVKGEEEETYSYRPIGHIQSIFLTRNGTVRQSGLAPLARASLTLNKVSNGNSPTQN